MRDDAPVKIVSLLPSATEIVFALGLGDQLCGVSFECDYPEAARTVPVVSGTSLDLDRPRTAAEVDAEVSAKVATGESIYTLDDARIRSINPDVILAQDLCQVCAVPSGAVEEALDVIGCRAEVVSLDPEGLDDVIECVVQVGRATGTERAARELVDGLHRRLDAVRKRVVDRPRPRVFVLEWADPPFNAGHWVPEMVHVAGGEPVLAAAGERSRRVTWEEIAAEQIDVTVFSPCGFDLPGAVEQAAAFWGDRISPTSGGSSPWMPMPTSRGPVPAWSTASSCWPHCSIRLGATRSFREPRSCAEIVRASLPLFPINARMARAHRGRFRACHTSDCCERRRRSGPAVHGVRCRGVLERRRSERDSLAVSTRPARGPVQRSPHRDRGRGQRRPHHPARARTTPHRNSTASMCTRR